jgi:hypothetical protein
VWFYSPSLRMSKPLTAREWIALYPEKSLHPSQAGCESSYSLRWKTSKPLRASLWTFLYTEVTLTLLEPQIELFYTLKKSMSTNIWGWKEYFKFFEELAYEVIPISRKIRVPLLHSGCDLTIPDHACVWRVKPQYGRDNITVRSDLHFNSRHRRVKT